MRSIHHRGISHFRSTVSLLFSTLFIAAMLFVGGSAFAHIPHDLVQSPYNLSDSSEHRWVAFYGAECDPPAHGTIEQITAARNPQIVGPGTGTGVVDVYSGQNRNPCIGAATGVVLPALQNGDLRLYARVESSQTGEDFWFYIYDLSGAKRYERYFGDNGFNGIAQYDLTGVSLPSGEYILGFTPGAQGATNVNDPLNTKGSVHFTSIELRNIPQPACSISAPSSVTQNAVFNFSWSSNNATHIAINYTGNTIFSPVGDPVPQTADMGSYVNGSEDLKIQASSGNTDITFCIDSGGTSGSYSDCQARNPHATCSKSIAVTPAAAPTCTMSVNNSPASANQSFTYTPGTAFNLTFNTANSTHGIYSLSGNSAYGGSHVSGESPVPSYGDLGTWPATPLTTTDAFHIDAGSGSTILRVTVDYNGTRSSSCSVTFNAPSGPSFRVQPTSATIQVGATQQFIAYYDPDGPGPNPEQNKTYDANWTSTSGSIATVGPNTGLATGIAVGNTTIRATYGGLTASATLTVTAVNQPTFVIDPPSAATNVGTSQQFIGWYDPDGPGGPQAQQDQTNNASWSSSNNSVATVTNFSPKGRADGVSSGSVTITAVYSGITATANLAVTSAPTHLECVSNACTRVSGPGSDACTPEGSSCGGGGNGGGGCCGAGGNGATGTNAVPTTSCGEALITWNDNSNDENGFKIERSNSQNGPWTEVGSVGADVTQFLDENISSSDNYFWRVRAFKGNNFSSYSNIASTNVTACPPPTLSVDLTANPISGNAPLNATLTASVSGTAAGTINYAFYCDRSDSGTNIASPWDAKFDGVSETSISTECAYTAAGTYTAKVIAERGGALPAEDRQTVNISWPALSASCSVSPASAKIGDEVIWTATAIGGTGSYGYSWSGNPPLQGKTGNPVAVIYTSTGIKSGAVTVTSGTQTAGPISCPNAVSITPVYEEIVP